MDEADKESLTEHGVTMYNGLEKMTLSGSPVLIKENTADA